MKRVPTQAPTSACAAIWIAGSGRPGAIPDPCASTETPIAA